MALNDRAHMNILTFWGHCLVAPNLGDSIRNGNILFFQKLSHNFELLSQNYEESDQDVTEYNS